MGTDGKRAQANAFFLKNIVVKKKKDYNVKKGVAAAKSSVSIGLQRHNPPYQWVEKIYKLQDLLVHVHSIASAKEAAKIGA